MRISHHPGSLAHTSCGTNKPMQRTILTHAAATASTPTASATKNFRLKAWSSAAWRQYRVATAASTANPSTPRESLNSQYYAAARAQAASAASARFLWIPSQGTVDWAVGDRNAASDWVRYQTSSSGTVDYSTLMAGPGTPLHNDIMESAARKQTGYVVVYG